MLACWKPSTDIWNERNFRGLSGNWPCRSELGVTCVSYLAWWLLRYRMTQYFEQEKQCNLSILAFPSLLKRPNWLTFFSSNRNVHWSLHYGSPHISDWSKREHWSIQLLKKKIGVLCGTFQGPSINSQGFLLLIFFFSFPSKGKGIILDLMWTICTVGATIQWKEHL